MSDQVYVGRRVLNHEMPAGINTVFDLTCEFPVPKELRSATTHYYQPILDRAPLHTLTPNRISSLIEGLGPPVFIQCAQGRGRTAMVAAAWLLTNNKVRSIDDALARIQNVRPGAVPRAAQRRAVAHVHEIMKRGSAGSPEDIRRLEMIAEGKQGQDEI